ncbi:MAG: tripartite tricarboxylate transporter substrate binding protein [Alphaproteobacteria bacterium]
MKKTLLAAVGAAALTLWSAGDAAAQKFKDVKVPSTISVIVAYSAGGGTDVLVRTATPYFEAAIEELSGRKTSLVVRNVPGAGGEVGWATLARAAPDGSTIGMINLPSIALVQAARDVPYAPFTEKFAPIGVDVTDPNIITVNDQFKSIEDMLEQAKAKPGSVTIGADGPLSDDHLAVYALQEATGATFTFIPYAGAAPANRSFLSKEVGVSIGNVIDYLNTKDASVDAAILLNERYAMVPDVPTFQEKTGVELAVGGSTRGWVTVAGTPADLLELYREAFALMAQNPGWIEDAKKRNVTLVEPKVGEAFGEEMKRTNDDVDRLLEYFKQGGYLK